MDLNITGLVELGFKYSPLLVSKPINVENSVFYTLDHLYPLIKRVVPSVLSFPFKYKNISEILGVIKKYEFQVSHSCLVVSNSGNVNRRIFFKGGIEPYADMMISVNVSTAENILVGDANTEDGWESNSLIIYYSLIPDSSRNMVKTVIDDLSQFKSLKSDQSSDKGRVLIFEKNEYNELCLNPYNVKGFDISLNDNYNDDFIDVHNKITDWISDFSIKNNKLVLFNGEPGTGKTNYLRHLLNSTPGVKKIYIPPYTVEAMADPSFLPILRREKDSLIIIEDAEKILQSRDNQESASVVSILLNICDGIMADILNFKVIATFNTDESNIDSALMRRGRMFAHYKFNKLTPVKTKKLFESVHGVEFDENKALSLAEIYNPENEFSKKTPKRSIGFV